MAKNLLDNMSDDALAGFGLGIDGLGARDRRLWGVQKSWWSNSETFFRFLRRFYTGPSIGKMRKNENNLTTPAAY